MLSVDFERRIGDFLLRPRFEAQDELVVLLGPSGSGKTLTLRAIAGLLAPDAGHIELPEGVVYDSAESLHLPPQSRNVGYVVQDLALFPHLSVAENIGFALQDWPRDQARERIAELIELLGLKGLESRLPQSTSGGQQQRVALGRALAARPRMLLLDEPFTALDASIRDVLRREVGQIQRRLGLAALFVTHDLQEAYAMADQIAIYDEGAVLQFGPRSDVFSRPASVRVAELLDSRNIFQGTVVSKNEDFVEVETPWFRGRARADSDVNLGDEAALCVRPENVIIMRHGRPLENLDTILDVQIDEAVATGNNHRLYTRLTGRPGLPECQIEIDVSAHPYEVMGIAARPDWRVAFSMEKTVAIPIRTP